MKIRTRSMRLVASAMAVAMLATACASDDGDTDTEEPAAEEEPAEEEPADDGEEEMDDEEAAGELSGEVVAAGSSTVLPVAERILEQYRSAQPGVDASYTSIGSGGGFERLCVEQDVDFSGASRAIKTAPEDMELAACEDAGIELLELQFAVDALTMVTSPETDFLECFTQEDIIDTFGPDGASTWDEVIDGAPAEPLNIFAPDTDSGTYGFMVEDVMGLEESRQDYSASADDNVIAQGVQSGPGTWGFFGFAYFANNQESLKAIAYDSGDGNCVDPSVEAAEDGSYGLTRPLFIYVRTDRLNENPAVADLVTFFLENAPENVEAVQYVNTPGILADSVAKVEAAMG